MLPLYDHLCRLPSSEWQRAIDTLSAEIHQVDRNATRIWFAFFPLDLHLAMASAADPAAMVRKLGLMGQWRLADQIDSSHRFFYAHRYWPQVKMAVQSFDTPIPADLAALISAVAESAARTARLDREFLLGLSAAALMTLRQVGVDAFTAAPGKVQLTDPIRARSPHQVMRQRDKDDWQGLFGFTRGINKRWTVNFDENDPDATFGVINGQEIASGAREDKREYRNRDPRCTPDEGPIPVECRAASCGTCWVGVIAGAEKLSPVEERDERRRMQAFGYIDSKDPQPLIRLACQARANGKVTIVIPPWNGIIGAWRRGS